MSNAQITICVILFAFVLNALLKRIKRCPEDKLMVITGSVGQDKDGKPRKFLCQHGGKKFVLPLVQHVQFLDLTPILMDIHLEGALSKENIRVNVPATFTVGISTEEGIMELAAEHLLGQAQGAVQELCKEIIYSQLRLVISRLGIEEIYSKRDEFMDMVSKNVETELNKVGLKLINANITVIRDEAGYFEAQNRQAEEAAPKEASPKRDFAFGEAEETAKKEAPKKKNLPLGEVE